MVVAELIAARVAPPRLVQIAQRARLARCRLGIRLPLLRSLLVQTSCQLAKRGTGRRVSRRTGSRDTLARLSSCTSASSSRRFSTSASETPAPCRWQRPPRHKRIAGMHGRMDAGELSRGHPSSDQRVLPAGGGEPRCLPWTSDPLADSSRPKSGTSRLKTAARWSASSANPQTAPMPYSREAARRSATGFARRLARVRRCRLRQRPHHADDGAGSSGRLTVTQANRAGTQGVPVLGVWWPNSQENPVRGNVS
jgi:hypothetical protein